MQDSSIRDEIAKFLPEQCLNSEKFKQDVIPYSEILKEIFCTPCTAYITVKEDEDDPDSKNKPKINYLAVDHGSRKVTLKVCKSAARQLWLLTDKVEKDENGNETDKYDPTKQPADPAYK